MNSLIKNIGIYIVFSLINQLLIALLWFVLAWKLPASQIGIYALVMFFIDFLSTISSFALSSAITRFYYSDKKSTSVLTNAFVILLVASIVSVILYFVFINYLLFLFPSIGGLMKEHVILFLSIIFISSLANFLLTHYTALRKAGDYVKYQLLRTGIFFVASLLLVYLGFSVIGIFLALLISFLSVSFLFLFKERDVMDFKEVSFPHLKQLFYYSFPLVLYAILGVVVTYFGRILLDRYTNLTLLGVYSFFLTLNLQANGLWNSFNRAWSPEIFSVLKENKEKATNSMKFFAFSSLFFYILIVGAIVLIGETFLFRILLKDVYFENRNIFYILLMQPFFIGVYTAFYPAYYYSDKTKKILLISLIISIIDIISTILMVRSFGLAGAAFAYFGIAVVTTVVYLFSFRKNIAIKKDAIIKLLLIFGIVIAIVLIVSLLHLYLLYPFLLFATAILIYKLGGLGEKKHLLFSFLSSVKVRLFKTNG